MLVCKKIHFTKLNEVFFWKRNQSYRRPSKSPQSRGDSPQQRRRHQRISWRRSLVIHLTQWSHLRSLYLSRKTPTPTFFQALIIAALEKPLSRTEQFLQPLFSCSFQPRSLAHWDPTQQRDRHPPRSLLVCLPQCSHLPYHHLSHSIAFAAWYSPAFKAFKIIELPYPRRTLLQTWTPTWYMCRFPGLKKCSPRIRQFDNFERLECWGRKMKQKRWSGRWW